MSVGKTLLAAVEKGDVALVRAALARGEDINQRDDVAFTPLIRAAYDNSLEIAQVLLGHGADIEAQCEENWPAAAYALSNGHFAMALLLRNNDANLDYIPSEVFVAEDEFVIQDTKMQTVIENAAGMHVWRNWQEYLLDQAMPSTPRSKPLPRL